MIFENVLRSSSERHIICISKAKFCGIILFERRCNKLNYYFIKYFTLAESLTKDLEILRGKKQLISTCVIITNAVRKKMLQTHKLSKAQYDIFSLSGCSPNYPQLTKVHQRTDIIPLPPQVFSNLRPLCIQGCQALQNNIRLLHLKQLSSCKNNPLKILNTWSHSAAGHTIID